MFALYKVLFCSVLKAAPVKLNKSAYIVTLQKLLRFKAVHTVRARSRSCLDPVIDPELLPNNE